MSDKQGLLWEFTHTGLIVLPGISWDEWTQCWEATAGIHRRSMFYIGDCLLAGEDIFGERYTQVVGDYSPETVRTAMWVAKRIPSARRRLDRLSFSKHQAVASLDAGDQDAVLDQAERERWSTAELRAAVKAHKLAKTERERGELFPSNEPPDEAGPQGSKTSRSQEVVPARAVDDSASFADGHGQSCYFCGEACNSFAANPAKWPLRLPVDLAQPGHGVTCCTGCVLLRVLNDGPRERALVVAWIRQKASESRTLDGIYFNLADCIERGEHAPVKRAS